MILRKSPSRLLCFGLLLTVGGAGGAWAQQPAPAPRFSRTTPELGEPSKPAGADTQAVLAAAGYSEAEIERLVAAAT